MVLRLCQLRGRRELLDAISGSIAPERRLTEDEFFTVLEKFKMRQLQPRRRHGRRAKSVLKPIERPSPRYCGLTKTEYARMSAEYIWENGRFLGLLAFKDVVVTDTVAETLAFVEAKIRRCKFEIELANLRRSSAEE